jgi:amino acid transporter
MNVSVPFSFGALPAQGATHATDEEIRRRTLRVLAPLGLVAGVVCGWALLATLSGAVSGTMEAEDTGSHSSRNVQAALGDAFLASPAPKFADSTARPLTLETTLALGRADRGEFN